MAFSEKQGPLCIQNNLKLLTKSYKYTDYCIVPKL